MRLPSFKDSFNQFSGFFSFLFIAPVFELTNLLRPYIFGFRSIQFYLLGMLLLCFCLFLSLFNNGIYSTTFAYAGLFLSSLSLISSKCDESTGVFLRYYVIAATVISTLGVLDYFFHLFSAEFMYRDTYRSLRLSGTFQDPNFFSFFLVFSLVLLAHSIVNFSRLVTIFCVLVISTAVALTFSRGGLLSLLLVLISFGVIKSRKYWIWLFALTILLLFAFIIYQHEFQGWLSGLVSRGSSGRTEVWEAYFTDIFPSNLLGSFGFASERGVTHTHNTLFQMFDHFGALSLLFIGLLLLVMFRLPYTICLLPLILTLDTLFTRCFGLMIYVALNYKGKL